MLPSNVSKQENMRHGLRRSEGPFLLFVHVFVCVCAYLLVYHLRYWDVNTSRLQTLHPMWPSLIFCRVLMSHACWNLFPCGLMSGDLFHHLQPRMTLIPISSPHLIHLLWALHCLRGAFKWQWYIWYITETKGRQGPVFTGINQYNNTPLWCCIKNSREPRNLSGPSAASRRDSASWGVCARIPLKCTTENEIWESPVKNHACNHLSSSLSLSGRIWRRLWFPTLLAPQPPPHTTH